MIIYKLVAVFDEFRDIVEACNCHHSEWQSSGVCTDHLVPRTGKMVSICCFLSHAVVIILQSLRREINSYLQRTSRD